MTYISGILCRGEKRFWLSGAKFLHFTYVYICVYVCMYGIFKSTQGVVNQRVEILVYVWDG